MDQRLLDLAVEAQLLQYKDINNEEKIMKSILEAGAIDVSRVKISKGIF